MGYWGEGLFENDHALDYLVDLAHDLGVESLQFPEDPVAVRQKLDDGTLKQTLNKLNDKKYSSGYFFLAQSEYHEYCLLAAAAMGLGAKIDAEDMKQLRKVYKKAGLLKEGTPQMKEALDGYKNDGTPWDFCNSEVLKARDREEEQPMTPEEQARGFRSLNVFPEGTMQRFMFDAMQKSWADNGKAAKANNSTTSEVTKENVQQAAAYKNTKAAKAAKEEQTELTVDKMDAKKWFDSM